MNKNEVNAMYCRQCQETAGSVACTRVGVCGIGSVDGDVRAMMQG